MKQYQNISDDTLESALESIKQIVRLRNTEDVSEVSNFNNIFIRGRKVNKVPTSSADVVAGTDCIGDFNATATFLYILIDNSGTIEWRRVALSSF